MRVALAILLALTATAFARDDGRYANSALKPWFDSLASAKGLCCSVADGLRLDDPDWQFNGQSYRVLVSGRWLEVPAEAVITVPNRVGYAMVWPVGTGADTVIRCFMPGAAT